MGARQDPLLDSKAGLEVEFALLGAVHEGVPDAGVHHEGRPLGGLGVPQADPACGQTPNNRRPAPISRSGPVVACGAI